MTSWPVADVDPCMRLVYRLPGRRPDRAWAFVARLRRRSYGEPYQCGLLHEHPGKCVWWTPGDYLRLAAPLLHPLEALPGPRVGMPDCPGCGRTVFGIACDDGEVWVVRDEHSAIAYGQPVTGASHEWTVRFDPCGCERREILPSDEAITSSTSHAAR